MKTMLMTLAMVATIAGGHCKHAAIAAEPTDQTVSGVWNLALHGDSEIALTMELRQEGAKVTGKLSLMGQDIEVRGEFVKGSLTLSGTRKLSTETHGPADVKLTATVDADGKLAGQFDTPHGPMRVTGERTPRR